MKDADIRAHLRAQDMARKQMQEQAAEQRELSKRPIRAVLLSTERRLKTGSALWRAMIGDWLYGAAGAFIGAATAPERHFATFRVTYADGRVKKEMVEVGSNRFYELSELCD